MIRKKLTEAELKVTPQRVLIYQIMQDLGHAPIDIITKRVQEANQAVTVSTVYRILDSFYEAGILSKIARPDGKIFYDVNTHEHHHVFSEDNNIIDIEDEELTKIIKQKISEKISDKDIIKKISLQITTSRKK